MKQHLNLKILSGVVVGVVILIIINSRQIPKDEPQSVDSGELNASIANQFNDNIRDVLARQLETEKKMQTLESSVTSQTAQDNTGLLDELAHLKEEIETLRNEQQQSTDSPLPKNQSHIKDIDSLLIKSPLNLQEKSYWERLNPKSEAINKPIKKTISPILYYTIPAGSDLDNTTLLSALIGEVPNEGKLMQPLFPFSAVISRGDLMASNGIPLPYDISGMKVSGYAIGVGSFLDDISCVRAYVTSILFTFDDGHFVTLGQEQMTSTTDLVNNESLGYLTNPYGNPCIHGKYFTNAPRVLSAMLASGGVQGIGEALSQWQMGSMTNQNGNTQVPTGSILPFMTGHAVADGSIKAADWLEKRLQGSFDMVFVPASIQNHPTHVSLHITQTIELDKQPNGRVLDYATTKNTIRDFSLK